MKCATIPENHYLLKRKNKLSGNTETVVYTGAIRNKPKGWNLVRILSLMLLLVCMSAHATDDKFFRALHQVETSGRLGPIMGDKNSAKGPLQIHRAYWQDACEYDKSLYSRGYDSVADLEYSKKIVRAYLNRYVPWAVKSSNYEVMSRCHNGGLIGYKKNSTILYWDKLQKELKKIGDKG